MFAALTSQDGLSGWWTTHVEAPEAAAGAIVQFTFGGDFNPAMEITAIEPDRRVNWKCVDGHQPWQDNRFEFELTDTGGEGGVRLRFWQHYATELDDDAYGTYNYNWGYYLQSLYELVTTGSGKPFKAPAVP